MTAALSHPTHQKTAAPRKLVWVGPLTIVVAALANLAIRGIATAYFGVPAGFADFQASTIIGSTIVYLLLAFLVFGLVGRVARHPISAYRLLAVGALVVSFLSPISALIGLFPIAGMTPPIFWSMLAMHVVTAGITIALLTTLAVKPARGAPAPGSAR